MQTITPEQQAIFAMFGQAQPQAAVDLSVLAAVVPAPVEQVVQVPQIQAAPILFSVNHDAAKGWLHPQFPSTFKDTTTGQAFFSADQYYCVMKTEMAHDKDAQAKMLAIPCVPVVNGQFDWNGVNVAHAQLNQLVREIKNFNPHEWLKCNVQIMRQAITLKFCQDENLFKLLLETGNAYLIYANPQDGFWGIGCTEQAALTGQVPSTHWGQNLLGNLLMELRNTLRTEDRPAWAHVMQAVPVAVAVEPSTVVAEVPVVVEAAPADVVAPVEVAPVEPVVEAPVVEQAVEPVVEAVVEVPVVAAEEVVAAVEPVQTEVKPADSNELLKLFGK